MFQEVRDADLVVVLVSTAERGYRLLVRYGLMYHESSSVKLDVVKFPYHDQPQRGVCASRAISKGEWLLMATGIASKGTVPESVLRFSILEHNRENCLLVGPIRFVNHECKPNCVVGS